jgi:hypothetical protein
MKTAIKKFILLFLPAFLLVSGNVPAAPLKKVRAAFSAFAYMAVGTVGGNSHFAGRLFLSRVGLVPNKDVIVRAVGRTPEVLGALQHGQVQAGVMSPPTTSIAARMGFRQVFDIASLELPFPTICIVSTRRFAEDLSTIYVTTERGHLYRVRHSGRRGFCPPSLGERKSP